MIKGMILVAVVATIFFFEGYSCAKLKFNNIMMKFVKNHMPKDETKDFFRGMDYIVDYINTHF